MSTVDGTSALDGAAGGTPALARPVDGTTAPDAAAGGTRRLRVVRETQRFGTIVVIGGGCYGGYYVRQLVRAERAGAITWERLLVVDQNAQCPVSTLPAGERPSALEVVTAEWSAFLRVFLGAAAEDPSGSAGDAIVPSPLMPHVMAGWLLDRARERWPSRTIAIEPLAQAPAVRWERAGDDGTHYVSFADWMCPINCIEPERCPHTRGARDWSMPVAIRAYAAMESAAGREVHGTYLFRCLHRAYGVGMLDVRDIVDADRDLAALGATGPANVLVGTVSHCHGALRRIVVGADEG